MEEILRCYRLGKYQKCLKLINLLPENNNLIENFFIENCKIICESLVIILENNSLKMYEAQEQLYLFFEKVTSLDLTTRNIPFQLKLTAMFNFIFWLLFYKDSPLNKNDIEVYLDVINKGLLRVLGQKNFLLKCSTSSEKILEGLCSLKDLILKKDIKTALLMVELIFIVILYIFKLKLIVISKFEKIITSFTEDLNEILINNDCTQEPLKNQETELCLFKFGLNNLSTLVSEPNFNVTDFICIFQSMISYLNKNFKKSLKTLLKSKISNAESLLNYLGALNSFELKNWNECLKFVQKGTKLIMQPDLKAKYYILQGKVSAVKRNYKEALKYFLNVLSLPSYPSYVYYYIGQQYGKMGLYDLMTDSFEKLIESLTYHKSDSHFHQSLEFILLSWIHCDEDINETGALYSLAVSYGLNERNQMAAETFEKLLSKSLPDAASSISGIIQIPNFLTILHEASLINLLNGNLVRAEQLALDAAERYIPTQIQKPNSSTAVNFKKDIPWLQRVIHHELLETDLEARELENPMLYSEELIFIFPQNMIALLILSEIQRIQEIEDYKITLSKIISTFSTYLATMRQKKTVDQDENCVWLLVKALTCKTCIKIAEVLMRNKETVNIEKMFQRALSCNRGDKDALVYYYNFLVESGKKKEALKLWRTFYKEEAAVTVDDVQSFALQYFLTSKIAKREIDRIHKEFLDNEL